MGQKDNMTNWIIVSAGSAQEMYVGKTELEEAEVMGRVQQRGVLLLDECRVIRSILIPNAGGGITNNAVVMPVSINRNPVQVVVTPVAYFWPDAETVKLLEEQIKKSDDSNVRHRAKDAGLELPGGMFHEDKHKGRM
jgi:hypothetical protein